jgi:hypothetical protein
MHFPRPGWLAVAAVVLAALGAPAVARGDAVTQWNANAQQAILSTGPTAHSSVLPAAMVQGAVYDAVNAIAGGYQPYLIKPNAPFGASMDAAVATAAYEVLVAVVPSALASLTTQYTNALAAVPAGTPQLAAAKNDGIAVGHAAAAEMIRVRTDDGRNPGSPFPFMFGSTPGVWRVSFPSTAPEPTPWVGDVDTFLVPNVEMLRTDGPNALTSKAYAKDFNEVKSLGRLHDSGRTDDQTNAALFWQAQPLFLWGPLMRTLSDRFQLTSAENARFFAMVSLAAADASIGCWNDKYYWNFWRPLDAIRLAATDGNKATEADPGWLPLFDPSTPTTPATALLATPVFPEHPSGHSCISSAILHTMQEFLGTDKIAFDIVSTRFPVGDLRRTRHFDRFSRALKEIIDARVWGGIHFRTADTQGAVLGKKVFHWERKHYFQPVG